MSKDLGVPYISSRSILVKNDVVHTTVAKYAYELRLKYKYFTENPKLNEKQKT